MSWQLSYNEELKIIVATHSGAMSMAKYREELIAAVELLKQHRTKRILVDNTGLVPQLGTFNIYDLPGLYGRCGLDKDVKIALTPAQTNEANESLSFYETVCQNQGYNVKLFVDRDKAIAWLLT